MIAHLDTPIEGSGNTQVVYLHYANAEEIAPILQGISDFEGQQDAGRVVRIHHWKTLIFKPTLPIMRIDYHGSTGRICSDLRKVINKLDVRRAQVLVETIIAEVAQQIYHAAWVLKDLLSPLRMA